jgi:P4 family phage/plasmid primase-like protien
MDQVNPYLFACANGTLETTTGQLLAPHPAHLCSRASKVAFRGMPQGKSRFAKFLLACFNDDRQVLDWYQMYLGYCMTADTSEHIFLVKQGEGSNGKTLTKIASFEIFGSYAVVMDKDVIIEAGGKRSAGSASSHLMALKGARLAESDESKEKSVLNEATIKELSGGSSITARELQGKQETFMVTHKAILNTNYKPIMENASFSLISRMALLPMTVTFKSAETINSKKSREKLKDSTLEAYLKSDDGKEQGLSWIAAGAKRYFEKKRAHPNPLVLEKRPSAMKDALKAYVMDNDVAKRFIEGCLEFEELQPGAPATWHLPSGEGLNDAFRTWIREEEISSSLTAQAVKKRVVLYADGANHTVEDGRFTDKTVQDKGQFKGLSGVRLKDALCNQSSGCGWEG